MSGRLTSSHLGRGAFVYVRQSTAAQVFENRESTDRQYGLADRARALGWPAEAVTVIDEDLGCSGATAEERRGFARLAHAVAHGQAGAILALEVSRLARSSQDWQHLLRLCAVAEVLVLDEQGIYDPGDRDDKLLLDLKGTMSEAELNWLWLRLAGGRLNKARRGALRFRPPAGYVWTEGGLARDADESACQAVRIVFERFALEPTAAAVVRWAHRTGFTFPTLPPGGETTSWKRLTLRRLCDLLHNPAYAGVYAFGRRPVRETLVAGRIQRVHVRGLDPEAWHVRIPDAHQSYISWETFLANQMKLNQNARGSFASKGGAPREGEALLGGLVVCGRCGRRMVVHYWGGGRPDWSYVCPGDGEPGSAACWQASGRRIDAQVEARFFAMAAPDQLELCLAVEREVGHQAEGLARQWKLRIERAEYEARLSERRYKAVDPDNRVVARSLEGDWEVRLRELEEVRRSYARARDERHVELSDADRARIRALARDLPAVWRASATLPADRQAMLRLAIEAVALLPVDLPERSTTIRIQWRTGAVTEARVARPRSSLPRPRSEQAITVIGEATVEGLTDTETAERLNTLKIPAPGPGEWTQARVRSARRECQIIKRRNGRPTKVPLPECHPDGRYSIAGAARVLGTDPHQVRSWIRRGRLEAEVVPHAGYPHARWVHLSEARALMERKPTSKQQRVDPSYGKTEREDA